MKLAIMTAALCLIALPVDAQTIALHPSQTVTIRMDAGRPVVEKTEPAAPISQFDAYGVWRAEIQDVPPGAKTVPPGFIHQGEGPPNPPALLPDRLQLTLRYVPGPVAGSRPHTALIIHNGYASNLRYRASMVVNGHVSPTDVCEVPGKLPGVEHWPYVIDEIDVSDLQLDASTGDITCQ